TDLMDESFIVTDLTGNSRDDIIGALIGMLDDANVLNSTHKFKEAILAREREGRTGVGRGIAISHGKSTTVKKPEVDFGIHANGVDWQSLDGTKAQLIFMIAVPEESAGDAHLKILQMLSRKLMYEAFRSELLQATTKEEAYKLLNTIE